jgi:hypothetical protein
LRVDDEPRRGCIAIIEVAGPNDITPIDPATSRSTMVNAQRVNKCKIRPEGDRDPDRLDDDPARERRARGRGRRRQPTAAPPIYVNASRAAPPASRVQMQTNTPTEAFNNAQSS